MAVLRSFEHELKRVLPVRRHTERDGVITLRVDLSALRLNFQPLTTFVLIPATRVTADPNSAYALVHDLRLEHGWLEQPCFMVVNAPLGRESRPSRHALLVVLDRGDLDALPSAPSLSGALVRHAREQLSRVVLSPYETSRPVSGGRFFNRDHERKLVIDNPNTNYVVMGMRRVGKTSLLQELARCMNADNDYGVRSGALPAQGPAHSSPDRRQHVVVVDCSPYRSTEQLLQTIVERIDPRLGQRFDPNHYVNYLRRASRVGIRRLQILLDEVDQFIALDRLDDWRATSSLRATANEGYARYVFAGQQQIMQGLIEKQAPLFNFATPLPLGAFSNAVARDLIRGPMGQLGVSIDDAIVNQVVNETGGHPNVLQFFCQSFIDRLDEEGRDRVLPEDFQRVLDEPSFDTFVLRTFADTTTIVEKMVVLATLQDDTFTTARLSNHLHERRVFLTDAALQGALNGLTYGGILDRTGPEYRLKLPVLRTLLRDRYDPAYLIKQVQIESPGALARGGGT